ncbi:hypothetical protein NDU88_003122 [Pleurodeles waltl]|uniref:Uncharacterized protein n=1 Tax=Pleurodeles waltl TaxID=8319 RepID=A0AAV7NIG4_PLEWA|nr:hypothetical protein NDU88_003122 [Pleurodeles waltl]
MMGHCKELFCTAHMEVALQRKVETESVNVVAAVNTDKKKPGPNLTQLARRYRRGGSYPHQGPCPAQGMRCSSCNKTNTFAKVCRSSTQKKGQKLKMVNTMQSLTMPNDEEDMDDDDDHGGAVNVIHEV